MTMKCPAKTPFLEALSRRLNQRIDRNNPHGVLAVVERNALLIDRIAVLGGDERRYLKHLARSRGSPLLFRLE